MQPTSYGGSDGTRELTARWPLNLTADWPRLHAGQTQAKYTQPTNLNDQTNWSPLACLFRDIVVLLGEEAPLCHWPPDDPHRVPGEFEVTWILIEVCENSEVCGGSYGVKATYCYSDVIIQYSNNESNPKPNITFIWKYLACIQTHQHN